MLALWGITDTGNLLRQHPKTPLQLSGSYWQCVHFFFKFHTLTKANYSTLALIPIPTSN